MKTKIEIHIAINVKSEIRKMDENLNRRGGYASGSNHVINRYYHYPVKDISIYNFPLHWQ